MLSRANSLLLNAALAVVLLAGAVAVAAETGMIVTEHPPGPSVLEHPTHKIGVRGHVKGLYPGVRTQMKVRVKNRMGQRVKLVSVRARVKNASAACTRGNLSARRFRGSRPMRAHSRTKVRVRVTMKASAPDACQGARFPIKFKARVTGKRP